MSPDHRNTQELILKHSKNEFLEKGYRGAQLRQIAKNAGVTTGAIYGYYSDKKALFNALTQEKAELLISRFSAAQEEFEGLPTETKKEQMFEFSMSSLFSLLDMLYDDFDAFKLIFCRSEGTMLENFTNVLINIEAENTKRFIDGIREAGYPVRMPSDNLLHILTSAYFSAILETVEHDMERQEAKQYVSDISAFFYSGWSKIMGI